MAAPAPAAALYSAASSYINHTKLGASSWHQLLRFLNFDINTFGKMLLWISKFKNRIANFVKTQQVVQVSAYNRDTLLFSLVAACNPFMDL